jgi:hypothetical protein
MVLLRAKLFLQGRDLNSCSLHKMRFIYSTFTIGICAVYAEKAVKKNNSCTG